MKSKTRQKKMA